MVLTDHPIFTSQDFGYSQIQIVLTRAGIASTKAYCLRTESYPSYDALSCVVTFDVRVGDIVSFR